MKHVSVFLRWIAKGRVKMHTSETKLLKITRQQKRTLQKPKNELYGNFIQPDGIDRDEKKIILLCLCKKIIILIDWTNTEGFVVFQITYYNWNRNENSESQRSIASHVFSHNSIIVICLADCFFKIKFIIYSFFNFVSQLTYVYIKLLYNSPYWQ